jgi:hypothetical protein
MHVFKIFKSHSDGPRLITKMAVIDHTRVPYLLAIDHSPMPKKLPQVFNHAKFSYFSSQALFLIENGSETNPNAQRYLDKLVPFGKKIETLKLLLLLCLIWGENEKLWFMLICGRKGSSIRIVFGNFS